MKESKSNCRPLIVIVGNCCSGKTTLVENLQKLGFNARSCLQEHSMAPKLWQRHNPDILIMLSCSVEVASKRRTISWGKTRWVRQKQILNHAFLHADIYIDTDDLTIEEVKQRAVDYITQWQHKHSQEVIA